VENGALRDGVDVRHMAVHIVRTALDIFSSSKRG